MLGWARDALIFNTKYWRCKLGKFTISKSEMLEILGDRDTDVTEDTVITAVTLTEDSVEFSLEEKEKKEVSSG